MRGLPEVYLINQEFCMSFDPAPEFLILVTLIFASTSHELPKIVFLLEPSISGMEAWQDNSNL